MALLRCGECTTLYSVGAPKCPQCGADKPLEEGAAKKKPVRKKS